MSRIEVITASLLYGGSSQRRVELYCVCTIHLKSVGVYAVGKTYHTIPKVDRVRLYRTIAQVDGGCR